MEEQRLKPMAPNYDEQKFNRLFKRTEGLRRKLTGQIDCKRFGVESKDILSWFSVKFIYAYNKYYEHEEGVLLGHLIKSLELFKFRILRKAYTQKMSQSLTVPFDPIHEVSLVEETESPDYYYTKFMNFIKGSISDNSYIIMETQFNPPPYILRRLKEEGIENIHKIPDAILCEYFSIETSKEGLKFITSCKKEIKEGIEKAKGYFR